MYRFAFTLLVAVFSAAAITPLCVAQHTVLLQGNDRLAIIDPGGEISWEMKWGGIHDLHLLDNGRILTRQGRTTVVEIDPKTKEIVWSYDSASRNGNTGKKVEVHAFQRLGNGNTMIAESGPARIIEVDRDGQLKSEMPLVINHPSAHSDTRLVRKLDTGNYLVAHEADGMVREYQAGSGEAVWEFEVPLFGREPHKGHGPEAFGNRLFCALRLPSGNTLIATGNGHSVIEVTPKRDIVWQLHQDDLPGIKFAWLTTLEVLPSGHYVIGNCHAGPGQPLLVEIDPKSKDVAWTLDRFDDFGNAVSNSLIVDAAGKSLR